MALCACGCGGETSIAKMTKRKYGHVRGMPVRWINGHNVSRPAADRFWEKVSKSDGCWEWTAFCLKSGYGWFGGKDGTEFAHRVSWVLANGAIPDGMFVLHKCDNRKCVNPAHLFLGTHEQNMADMVSKGRSTRGPRKTHCKRGHPRTPENLLKNRGCRVCVNAAARERDRATRTSLSSARSQ